MTSSNGNILRVTGPLCGEFTAPSEFPAQRPVTRSFDVFFDPRLNKRLSKQPLGLWFETPAWSLWRHRNDMGSLVQSNSVMHDGSDGDWFMWVTHLTMAIVTTGFVDKELINISNLKYNWRFGAITTPSFINQRQRHAIPYSLCSSFAKYLCLLRCSLTGQNVKLPLSPLDIKVTS